MGKIKVISPRIFISAVFLALFTQASLLLAQPTPLSGVVNLYRKVSFVDCPNNTVTVTPNTTGYSVGDRVLLIQMEGVTVDETNTGAFGSITDIEYAGNYEFHTIASIAGNDITFQFQILRDYDPVNGAVQLVRVAHHLDAEIQAAGVDLAPYDPVTQLGGVVAIWVEDTLYFGGNINGAYQGFPGGEANYDYTNCNWSATSDWSDYFYYWATSATNFNGAPKGYGIQERIPSKQGGRGRLANGGGGGNQHNAGGGGGGNYGAGGRGGIRAFPRSGFWGLYCKGYYYGVGGGDLSTYYSNAENRIFMGGGGGAGHVSNSSFDGLDGRGGVGGPIVIVKAGTVRRSGSGARYINAQGENGFPNGSDGSGGGGAGGTVLLDIGTFSGSNVFHVRAQGGRGGNQSWTGAVEDCMGAGGGGGGGVIWYSDASINTVGMATRNVTAGLEGNMTGAGCTAVPADTTNRKHQPGSVGIELTGLVLPISSTLPNGCVLPVEFEAFEGEQIYNDVRLDWLTSLEKENKEFIIERAEDLRSAFVEIGRVDGSGFSSTTKNYSFTDRDPVAGENFYRLRQVDLNGGYSFSEVVRVEFKPEEQLIHKIYPNPVNQGRTVTLEFYLEGEENASITVLDQVGRTVFTESGNFLSGRNRLEIPTHQLHAGIYFLQMETPTFRDAKRFIVQ